MDNTQYQKLAAEFIEMWQKQLGNVVTDQRFVEQMFAGLQQMANYANPGSYERPVSTATDDVDERLGELDFRLRMAEERIGKLESELQSKAGAKRAATGRKPASKKKVSKPAKRS